uniref:ABC transporter ATP-binding protein n=1 Tax=Proteiniclasticum sediminis TaxID=2804028 RepID=UPI002ED78A0D
MPVIEVQNLTKSFRMNKKYPGFRGALKSFFSTEYTLKTAVDNISFTIQDGEIVGYIGANGAGKSTTIKMMTGILTPTSGEVRVNGVVPYEDRQKNARDIGVVFGQKTQLWWDLPLSETFTLLRDIYEVSPQDFEERMAFLDEVLELKEFLLTPVRALSLGQRMRGDLAAALIHNPKVVYLDEPTIGLDVVVKENVRKAIQKINATYGTTVILTTHDLTDIEELCSRIIIIDAGKKIYDGNLAHIKEKFGYMSSVEFLTGSPVLPEKVEFIRSLDPEYLELEYGENRLQVKFNRNNTSTTEITRQLMGTLDVLEFSIKETSIEDIVKKIYRNEV